MRPTSESVSRPTTLSEACDGTPKPEPNGCGAEDGPDVPDVPLGVVDFRAACDVHDICFGTPGADLDVCHANFDRDLKSAVGQTQASVAALPPSVATPVSGLSAAMARLYSIAVRTGAGRAAFNAAQRRAASKLSQCRASGGI